MLCGVVKWFTKHFWDFVVNGLGLQLNWVLGSLALSLSLSFSLPSLSLPSVSLILFPLFSLLSSSSHVWVTLHLLLSLQCLQGSQASHTGAEGTLKYKA